MKAASSTGRAGRAVLLFALLAVFIVVSLCFDLAAAQEGETQPPLPPTPPPADEGVAVEEEQITPDEELMPCGAPIFAPPGGDFGVATTVDVIALIDNARVHYSLDGTEPTKYSPIWSDKLLLEERGISAVLKVMVYKPGFCSPGATVTMTYNILDECAPVEFSPAEGSYQDDAKVFMKSSTCPQAHVYFTMDGSVPTPDMSNPSTLLLVDGYFVVDELGYTTLTAVASSKGWLPSPAAEATIHIYPRLPLPAFQKRNREEMLLEMDKAFRFVVAMLLGG